MEIVNSTEISWIWIGFWVIVIYSSALAKQWQLILQSVSFWFLLQFAFESTPIFKASHCSSSRTLALVLEYHRHRDCGGASTSSPARLLFFILSVTYIRKSSHLLATPTVNWKLSDRYKVRLVRTYFAGFASVSELVCTVHLISSV